MNRQVNKQKRLLEEINIRHELQSGDMGYILYMHGSIYGRENQYGLPFERYVAESLVEFYEHYDSQKDRVWICEHNDNIIGTLFLMHRKQAAQLRYFLLKPDYRNCGLGTKLMQDFMEWVKKLNYQSVYLWTTHEQLVASKLYRKFGFELSEEAPSTKFGKALTEQKFEWYSK
ncbi:MAG TPA: GNAT family N-acetyltransferase [Balneolales bacterium]|nr:GNAT family N-acetyltransferase [Balneolales bacterium]